jgi:outer membrane protein OmpA-like peptidoglycan-associated protein
MKKLLFLLFILPNSLLSQNKEVLYKLEELGKNVNTRYHETAPLVTGDNQRLYFTVSNHPQNNEGVDNTQDIWYSDRLVDGNWGQAQHMGSPFNNRKFNQVLCILDDGNTLLIRGGKNKNKEGFSLTTLSGGNWSKPEAFDIKDFEEMNNGRFSGAVISQDRSVLIIYMSERTGKAFSDFYLSKLQNDGSYSKPEMVNSLSTPQDEFGQYLTNNDKTMYFASNRQGGLGDVDVWKTERLDGTWQKWSEPKNIGAPINTAGFDSYFSIDQSGKNAFTTRTYVSADGSNMNIYALVPKPKLTVKGTVFDEKSNEPIALQLSINSEQVNKFSLAVKDNGQYSFTTLESEIYQYQAEKLGYSPLTDAIDLIDIKKDTTIVKNLYLSPTPSEIILYGNVLDAESKYPIVLKVKAAQEKWNKITETTYTDGAYRMRLKGEGPYKISINDSIYETIEKNIKVTLEEGIFYKEVRQDFLLKKRILPYVLSGYTFDNKTKKPISATVALDDNDKILTSVKSDETGFYTFAIPEDGIFKVRANKEGYLNSEDKVNVFDNQDFLYYNKDLYLDPIEVGVTVIIKNIYFNFDKTDLKAESYPELNRLKELMQTNQGITIEIGGHTDDKGSDDYNAELSEGRANSVMNYLLEQGIANDRMVAKGYGEAQPISTNYSDEGRAENRRVVFTILSK